MLLKGKPVVKQLKLETKKRLEENNKMDGYVALFLLSDDTASEVYVGLKATYAKELGIYADIKFGKDRALDEVLEEIQQCNADPLCLGIMVQLPIGDSLNQYQQTILESIEPTKDIDGLTSNIFGGMGFGYHHAIGATPRSALTILDHYELGGMEGKYVLVISQSNLIGKRLALACMHRGATVLSANHFTSSARLAQMINMSEIVFSATGVKHLINGATMQEENDWINKVFVDIGRGTDNGGPHGDIDGEFLQDKVKAITPVPGGVGPVTVACLFHNITKIHQVG